VPKQKACTFPTKEYSTIYIIDISTENMYLLKVNQINSTVYIIDIVSRTTNCYRQIE